MNALEQLRTMSDIPLTTSTLLTVLQSYRRPYDKISDWVLQGVLIQLRRGLYVVGPALNAQIPSEFQMANLLYGPSCVSMYSALSHWGLIPERVYLVESVTIKPGKHFGTPRWNFEYYTQRQSHYHLGIQRVQVGSNRQFALMAGPEKALSDVIIQSSHLNLRSVSQTIEFLEDDIRFYTEALADFDLSLMHRIAEGNLKSSSLRMLIKTIEKNYVTVNSDSGSH